MDTYNRGFEPSIEGLRVPSPNEDGDTTTVVRLGKARLLFDSQAALNNESLLPGFYAIAYDMSEVSGFTTGETVISYRGSDRVDETAVMLAALGFANPLFPSLPTPGDDATNGYGVALGFIDGPQASLAIEFYRAVAGEDNAANLNLANITLTGHSLGGGLAGLVAGIYNRPGYFVDPMQFGLAVNNAFDRLNSASNLEVVTDFRELVTGGVEQSWARTTASEFRGAFIPRETAETIDAARSNGLDLIRDFTPLPIGAPLRELSLAEETGATDTDRNRFGQLHNDGLIVMRLFSETLSDNAWHSVTAPLIASLFNESIGEAAGAAAFDNRREVGGIDDRSGTLRTAVAYSVLDEGERPFGDTAVRAMFDDANDLGGFLSRSSNLFDDDTTELATDVIVELAGILAFNDVESSNSSDAAGGVFDYSSNQSSLTINLTASRLEQLVGELPQGSVRAGGEELSGGSALANELFEHNVAQIYDVGSEATRFTRNFNSWLAQRFAEQASVQMFPDSPLRVFRPGVGGLVEGISLVTSGGGAILRDVAGVEGYTLRISDSGLASGISTPRSAPNINVIYGGMLDEVGGSEQADAFIVGSLGGTINGFGGDDFFAIRGGEYTIDGGDGDDTVVLGSAIAPSGTQSFLSLDLNEDGVTAETFAGLVTLTDVETVIASAGTIIANIGRQIDADDSFDIFLELVENSILTAAGFRSGAIISVGGSSGRATDPISGGSLGLNQFTTEIIGSDFDDLISDRSDEDKVISAGDGDDDISVFGTEATSVIFGGEGSDEISGSLFDDYIIDHGQSSQFTRSMGSALFDGRVLQVYSSVSAGDGNDTIIVGSDANLSNFTGSRFGPIGSGYFVDGGSGDDLTQLTDLDGRYYYSFSAGDGNDTIIDGAISEDISGNPLARDSVSAPQIAFDLSEFSASSIAATFQATSITFARDAGEARASWEIAGMLTLTIAGEGSITLANTRFNMDGDADQFDELVSLDEIDLSAEFSSLSSNSQWLVETADGGPVILQVNFGGVTNNASPVSQSFSAAQFLFEDEVTTSNEPIGDQDAFLSPGDQTITGGDGLDRLIVTWDLDALTSTLSGDQIVIEDLWGLVGSTTLVSFDEIYDVATDTTYTPEEFHAELQSRRQGETLTGDLDDNTIVGSERRDTLSGGAGDDLIQALGGDDRLDGGTGADTLEGGAGDDVYVVNDAGDIVVELSGEGSDLVEASINYTLSDNVEDLLLRGSTATTATGNALDNRITGTFQDNVISGLAGDDWLDGFIGNDEIYGGEGNDVLVGGLGDDTLVGGLGDDTYVIDVATDTLIELAGEGSDTVNTRIDYTLAENFENLVLSGVAISGTGNAEGNRIIGNVEANVLAGLDGDDWIDGRDGDDEILGGLGNDRLEGGLGADILGGGLGEDRLDGGADDDELDGGADNDVLVGGAGFDYLVGGDGDDILYGDINRGFAADSATSSEDGTGDPEPGDPVGGGPGGPIGDPIGGDTFDTLEGGAGNDILFAGAVDTDLFGGEGDDLLFGGVANDLFFDEAGNDLYVGDGIASLADIGLTVARNSDREAAADSLIFEGQISDFAITALGNHWFQIEHLDGSGETDYAVNINELVFEHEGGEDILVLDAPTASEEDLNFGFDEDQAISFSIGSDWFADANGNAISYSIGSGSDALVQTQATITDGVVSLGIIPDFAGTIEFELIATSLTGSTTRMVELNVAPTPDAPRVARPIDGLFVTAGEEFAINLNQSFFSDVDGDDLTLTATLANGDPLPAWLSYDGTSLTGTPPADAVDQPALGLIVTASDGELSASLAFDLFVGSEPNQVPTVEQPLADVAFDEDTPVQFGVPSGTFADGDGDILTVSASLADGSELPSWLTFDGSQFAGTPPQDFNGILDIAVTANDGQDSVSSVFALTINPVNDAPFVASPIGDLDALGGDGLQVDISGVFDDVDGDDLSLSLTTSDGSLIPAWLSIENGVLTANDIPNETVSLDLTVTADDGTEEVADDFTLTIEAQNPGAGSPAGFSFVSLNSWYNPAWGGGYNITFEYEVQEDAIIDGELSAWDILANYSGPGTVVGGWVSSFPGPASITPMGDSIFYTNLDQGYQPDLEVGDTFLVSVQVDGAGYSEGDFDFTFFDRDPSINLGTDVNAAFSIGQTNDWGSGISQSISFTNVGDASIDDWQVVLDVPDGVTLALTNAWGAEASVLANGDVLFTPASWNQEVAPGQQANFGFTASYTGASSLSLSEEMFSFANVETDTSAQQSLSVQSGNDLLADMLALTEFDLFEVGFIGQELDCNMPWNNAWLGDQYGLLDPHERLGSLQDGWSFVEAEALAALFIGQVPSEFELASSSPLEVLEANSDRLSPTETEIQSSNLLLTANSGLGEIVMGTTGGPFPLPVMQLQLPDAAGVANSSHLFGLQLETEDEALQALISSLSEASGASEDAAEDSSVILEEGLAENRSADLAGIPAQSDFSQIDAMRPVEEFFG